MSTPVQVTVIGAGSIVFSLGLVKDMCLTKGLAGSKVYFMDINAERLEVIYNLAKRYAEDLGADLQFDRTLDRMESLREADFVISTATITHNEHFMKRRRELTKVVRHAGEEAKVAVRAVRRDANEHLKKLLKDKQVPEDEERRAQDEVQRLTDRMIAEIDRLVTAKEAEVMAV